MKKLIAALALVTAGVAVPAFAGVGLSIELGAPGFYGQLDIGGYRPRVLYNEPVIVQRGYYNQAPVYLRVPAGQDRNWRYYCGRYNACNRPVYFVRDDWYRNDYAPRYRNEHARDHRDNRWDNRRDYGNDRRDDHYGHDQGRGNDHRNDGHGQGNDRGHDNGHNQNNGNGRPGDGRDDHDGHHDGNDGRR